MEYLNIIEENFSHSDYVAYLRGSILMWLLEDKPLDIPQFKLYADKLVEVMEEQSTDTTDDECHCLQTQAPEPMVDPDEPKVQPKPKFNIGDYVIIKYNDYTGTIVRLPMEGVNFPEGYVVELDDNRFGWTGTRERVECNGGWFASEKNLELINKVALEPNKWYHTTDFTVDELQALLPSGTQVEVEAEVLYNDIKTTPPTKVKQATVEKIAISDFYEKVFIGTVGDNFYKEWFKIVQED